MRIAVVTTSWPSSEGDPAGHFVRSEARELVRAGSEVVVVAPSPGGAFGWPGVAARVREHPTRALDAARWVVHARARLRILAVDRAVAHWAVPCGWPIAAASPRAELEVVSHGGDVRAIAALPGPARHFVVGAITARAKVWRFVAESLLRELLETLPGELRSRVERVALVRAATLEMPDVRDAVARRRGSLAGLRVGVSVGRLVAGKRLERVIDHVARSREVDTLVVVGDGPERDRLERFARVRGVEACFVGKVPREDALAWIGAAHVVFHASAAEGLNTVVREAEALGTPVRHMGD
jgi:glycosyltransferase involved in cell wall biosynthesis